MDPHRESSSLKVVQEGSDGITLPRPLHTTTTLQFARQTTICLSPPPRRLQVLLGPRQHRQPQRLSKRPPLVTVVATVATRVLCLIETRSLFLFPVPVPPLIHARSFSRSLYAARPPLCMN
ncbi:hypothetical protein HBH56_068450 [Parastagonospora nodorum]|nr:hypothetical protein HBH56_068450 [Parastagonospora nodorum]KAH3955079.1 hypothetical protein HBH53_014690 [Parastagonospora nodorum]KAH3986061.1 hypothetical protein HBH52_045850 [Parastagonospora nodorum]KAH4109330.1 hypothetical protein HBH46_028850 [Parastagonospora nodorum]KAH4165696.1 hypothetical protein HBH44_068680 [Parastagonospora nodorum]